MDSSARTAKKTQHKKALNCRGARRKIKRGTKTQNGRNKGQKLTQKKQTGHSNNVSTRKKQTGVKRNVAKQRNGNAGSATVQTGSERSGSKDQNPK